MQQSVTKDSLNFFYSLNLNFHVLLVIYYLFIIFWNGHSAALLYSDLHGVKMEINQTEFNLKKHYNQPSVELQLFLRVPTRSAKLCRLNTS